MSYAANLGRDRIIALLHELGATDLCVVSQPFRNGRQTDGGFAQLLLDHGADPNIRASLRKRLRGVDDESLHEYHDVTPLAWGERFHDQAFVNRAAMRLITERGGT